jgi:glutathione S-transferase
MFFEQNQVEAQLASARFMALTGRAELEPEVFAAKVAAARRALDSLERGLADGRAFVAGEDYTVADIALHGYVHCGAEGGADPAEHRHVRAWLERVEATPGFENDLTPIPEHAKVRA